VLARAVVLEVVHHLHEDAHALRRRAVAHHRLRRLLLLHLR